jgi:hypothetical protein
LLRGWRDGRGSAILRRSADEQVVGVGEVDQVGVPMIMENGGLGALPVSAMQVVKTMFWPSKHILS